MDYHPIRGRGKTRRQVLLSKENRLGQASQPDSTQLLYFHVVSLIGIIKKLIMDQQTWFLCVNKICFVFFLLYDQVVVII